MSIKRIPAAILLAAAPLVLAAPAPAEPTAYVVDDDRAQCAGAGYASIAEAVMDAPAGATVRVCPGVYRERVEIDKPLHLIGQPADVDALDCFDPTWTVTPLDTTVLPVIERPTGDDLAATPAPLLRLDADGIEVAGFAVRSLVQPVSGNSIYTPAVQADGANAGFWIHHNLVQGTNATQDRTFGIELGSTGAAQSRVDHNCLRGNTWAFANQRYQASSVRIDHNDSFRQGFFPYEIGWPVAGMTDVRLDHNHSIADGSIVFRIENSSAVQVDHNIVEAGGVGVAIAGANDTLEITENSLVGGTALGIVWGSATSPSTRVVVNGNTVQGYNNGIQLSLNANTHDAVITDNRVSGNRLSGIQIGPSNRGARVEGNISDGNGSYGIRTLPGAAGNSFIANSMHGNGLPDGVGSPDVGTDAFEGTVGSDGTLGNIWTGNVCETDQPPGAICTAL